MHQVDLQMNDADFHWLVNHQDLAYGLAQTKDATFVLDGRSARGARSSRGRICHLLVVLIFI